MFIQLKFSKVLVKVLMSKITLSINLLLIINCIWNMTRSGTILLKKLLVVILISYNIFNALISYMCSRFYVKIEDENLILNTFGFKEKINLRKAEYTIISEQDKVLKNRLSGISINGLNFGKYSLRNNCGNTFVYSAKEKGMGVIVSDEKNRLFLRTDAIEHIVKLLRKAGKQRASLQYKRELPQTFDKRMVKHILVSNALVVLPMIVLCLCQNCLPDYVPIHWNYLGEITSYWTKEQFIFCTPLAVLCFNIGFCLYCAKQKMNRAYIFYTITLIYILSLGIMLYILGNCNYLHA